MMNDSLDIQTNNEQGDELVDRDLSPAAMQSRNVAVMSLIDAEDRRMVASFLGRDDYEEIEEQMCQIKADLLLGSLPEFVHQCGGRIVWAIRTGSYGRMVNAQQRTVESGGKVYRILQEGYLFVYFADERVVVSANSTDRPDGPVIFLRVRSDTSSNSFFQQWRKYACQHNHLRGQAFFADGKIIERKKAYTWDDILLPEQTKRTIRTHVESFLQNRLRLKGLGIKARRGIILAGAPGTGKTLLGKILADSLDVSFMWVSPRHVRNTASFEKILSVARFVAPTVVFLEDLDLFGAERSGGGDGPLGELMNQLDGAVDNEDIVTIATTNHLKVVENALRNRPGRFDRIIKFKAMEVSCRRRLLAKLLNKAAIADGDISYLVEATDDCTGAQIEELVNTLYILGVDGNNGNTDEPSETQSADVAPVSVNRQLIDAALDDACFEKKGKLGFRVA